MLISEWRVRAMRECCIAFSHQERNWRGECDDDSESAARAAQLPTALGAVCGSAESGAKPANSSSSPRLLTPLSIALPSG